MNTPPGSPTGPLCREMPVSRAIFYISLVVRNKGLPMKYLTILSKAPAQQPPLTLRFPNMGPMEGDGRFQSLPLHILQGSQ